MVVVMTGETPWTNIVGGSSRVSTCTGKKSVKVFSQIIRIITYVHINTFCSKSVNTKLFFIQIHKMHIIVFRLNIVLEEVNIC